MYNNNFLGALSFTHDELKCATENFTNSRLIGKGGFGKVFRGIIRHTNVAIKLLTKVSYTKLYKLNNTII